MQMRRPRVFVAVLAPLLLGLLAGCSSGDGGGIFALCGNGRLDPGEQCDTGEDLSDSGDCLTSCVIAICGDTFVDLNDEQCDSNNLRLQTCTTIGFDGGTLVCSPACQFDTSGCGPALTPTPTATPGATATPTPRSDCGNGVLQPGETCDTCPADCTVQPCDVAPPEVPYTVNFTPPSGESTTVVTVLIGYNSSVLNLPAGSAATSRIRNLPPNSLRQANNFGYAVEVEVMRSSGLPTGRLFTVNFDSCVGAPPPTMDDVSCILESCANSSGAVAGCTCTITGP